MAMKKSIGRTLAHIDVAANSSVRIHKDFFNTHSAYHQQSRNEIGSDNPCSRHLSCNRVRHSRNVPLVLTSSWVDNRKPHSYLRREFHYRLIGLASKNATKRGNVKTSFRQILA